MYSTTRRLLLLNFAIIALIALALVFAGWQAMSGPMFDGRGVLALLALVGAILVGLVRDGAER